MTIFGTAPSKGGPQVKNRAPCGCPFPSGAGLQHGRQASDLIPLCGHRWPRGNMRINMLRRTPASEAVADRMAVASSREFRHGQTAAKSCSPAAPEIAIPARRRDSGQSHLRRAGDRRCNPGRSENAAAEKQERQDPDTETTEKKIKPRSSPRKLNHTRHLYRMTIIYQCRLSLNSVALSSSS